MSEKLSAHDAMETGIKIAEDHQAAVLEMAKHFPEIALEKLLHGNKVWLATQIMKALCDLDVKGRRVSSFMDGIDWQHHLGEDCSGTELFPDEESLREKKTCLSGGCGVVEVETRLIRWVEKQDLKFT